MPITKRFCRSYSAFIGSKQAAQRNKKEPSMTTRRNQAPANKSARPLAFIMAVVATVAMLQSVDSLASREHGPSVIERVAGVMISAVRGA
jgi:hypothetical protein